MLVLLFVATNFLVGGAFLQPSFKMVWLQPPRSLAQFTRLDFEKVRDLIILPNLAVCQKLFTFTLPLLPSAALWKSTIKRGGYQNAVRGLSHMASAPWGRFAEIDSCHALKDPVVPSDMAMRPEEFLEDGRCRFTHPFGFYSRRFFLFCDNPVDVDGSGMGCEPCERFFAPSSLEGDVYRSAGPASVAGHFELGEKKTLMRQQWLMDLEPQFDEFMVEHKADPKAFDFIGVVRHLLLRSKIWVTADRARSGYHAKQASRFLLITMPLFLQVAASNHKGLWNRWFDRLLKLAWLVRDFASGCDPMDCSWGSVGTAAVVCNELRHAVEFGLEEEGKLLYSLEVAGFEVRGEPSDLVGSGAGASECSSTPATEIADAQSESEYSGEETEDLPSPPRQVVVAVEVSSPDASDVVATLSSVVAGASLKAFGAGGLPAIAENLVDLVIPSPADADGIQRSELVMSWSLDMSGSVVYAVSDGRVRDVLVKSFRVMQWLTARVPGAVGARRCQDEAAALKSLVVSGLSGVPVRTYAIGRDEEDFDTVVTMLRALIEERSGAESFSGLSASAFEEPSSETVISGAVVGGAQNDGSSAGDASGRTQSMHSSPQHFHTAKAKYPNTCMHCSEYFPADTLIASFVGGGWGHLQCARDCGSEPPALVWAVVHGRGGPRLYRSTKEKESATRGLKAARCKRFRGVLAEKQALRYMSAAGISISARVVNAASVALTFDEFLAQQASVEDASSMSEPAGLVVGVEPLGKDVVHVRDAIDVVTDRLMEVDPLEPMVAGLADSEPSGVTSQKPAVTQHLCFVCASCEHTTARHGPRDHCAVSPSVQMQVMAAIASMDLVVGERAAWLDRARDFWRDAHVESPIECAGCLKTEDLVQVRGDLHYCPDCFERAGNMVTDDEADNCLDEPSEESSFGDDGFTAGCTGCGTLLNLSRLGDCQFCPDCLERHEQSPWVREAMQVEGAGPDDVVYLDTSVDADTSASVAVNKEGSGIGDDRGPLPSFLRWLHAFPIRQAMSDLLGVVEQHGEAATREELASALLECGGAIRTMDDAFQLLTWYTGDHAPLAPTEQAVAVDDHGTSVFADMETMRLRRAEQNAGVVEAFDVEECQQSSRPTWWSGLGSRSRKALLKQSVRMLRLVQDGLPLPKAVSMLYESGTELEQLDQAKQLLAWQQRKLLVDSPGGVSAERIVVKVGSAVSLPAHQGFLNGVVSASVSSANDPRMRWRVDFEDGSSEVVSFRMLAGMLVDGSSKKFNTHHFRAAEVAGDQRYFEQVWKVHRLEAVRYAKHSSERFTRWKAFVRLRAESTESQHEASRVAAFSIRPPVAGSTVSRRLDQEDRAVWYGVKAGPPGSMGVYSSLDEVMVLMRVGTLIYDQFSSKREAQAFVDGEPFFVVTAGRRRGVFRGRKRVLSATKGFVGAAVLGPYATAEAASAVWDSQRLLPVHSRKRGKAGIASAFVGAKLAKSSQPAQPPTRVEPGWMSSLGPLLKARVLEFAFAIVRAASMSTGVEIAQVVLSSAAVSKMRLCLGPRGTMSQAMDALLFAQQRALNPGSVLSGISMPDWLLQWPVADRAVLLRKVRLLLKGYGVHVIASALPEFVLEQVHRLLGCLACRKDAIELIGFCQSTSTDAKLPGDSVAPDPLIRNPSRSRCQPSPALVDDGSLIGGRVSISNEFGVIIAVAETGSSQRFQVLWDRSCLRAWFSAKEVRESMVPTTLRHAAELGVELDIVKVSFDRGVQFALLMPMDLHSGGVARRSLAWALPSQEVAADMLELHSLSAASAIALRVPDASVPSEALSRMLSLRHRYSVAPSSLPGATVAPQHGFRDHGQDRFGAANALPSGVGLSEPVDEVFVGQRFADRDGLRVPTMVVVREADAAGMTVVWALRDLPSNFASASTPATGALFFSKNEVLEAAMLPSHGGCMPKQFASKHGLYDSISLAEAWVRGGGDASSTASEDVYSDDGSSERSGGYGRPRRRSDRRRRSHPGQSGSGGGGDRPTDGPEGRAVVLSIQSVLHNEHDQAIRRLFIREGCPIVNFPHGRPKSSWLTVKELPAPSTPRCLLVPEIAGDKKGQEDDFMGLGFSSARQELEVKGNKVFAKAKRLPMFDSMDFFGCIRFMQNVQDLMLQVKNKDTREVALSVYDAVDLLRPQMVRIYQEAVSEDADGGGAVFSEFWHLTLHYMLMRQRIFVSEVEEWGYAAGDGGEGETVFIRQARRRVTSSLQAVGQASAAGGYACVCFVCGSSEHLAVKHKGEGLTTITDAIKRKVRAAIAACRVSVDARGAMEEKATAFWARSS